MATKSARQGKTSKSARQGMTTIAVGQERLRDLRVIAEFQGKNVPALVREAIDAKLSCEWHWRYEVADYLVTSLHRFLASDLGAKLLADAEIEWSEWFRLQRRLRHAIDAGANREYADRFPDESKARDAKEQKDGFVTRSAHEPHWDFDIPVIENFLHGLGA